MACFTRAPRLLKGSASLFTGEERDSRFRAFCRCLWSVVIVKGVRCRNRYGKRPRRRRCWMVDVEKMGAVRKAAVFWRSWENKRDAGPCAKFPKRNLAIYCSRTPLRVRTRGMRLANPTLRPSEEHLQTQIQTQPYARSSDSLSKWRRCELWYLVPASHFTPSSSNIA